MRHALLPRTIPALGLGIALTFLSPTSLHAQLPPSSGSGAGTGTGMSSGYPGSTGTGMESMGSRPLPSSLPNPNLTRPIDLPPIRPRDTSRPIGMTSVSPVLFLDARSVTDPGERALALLRISDTAISSKQFEEAHTALFEAGPAALAERNVLIREQRLTAIVGNLIRLAEERMSEASDSDALVSPDSATTPVPPPPPPTGSVTSPSPSQTPQPPPTAVTPLPRNDRMARLRTAVPEWTQAVELARKIDKITARTESLYRIVESESFSSWKLITDPLRRPGARPDPSSLDPELRGFADYLLASSAYHASMIERPIWRDAASYSIVANAAASSQFQRGFQIARAIAQPEARTDALIRLAEGQALNNRPNEATAAYEEAARSVALIPQEDPRETLVGVLIDSLISFGRFDDARACVPIYSFPSRQLVALSAVAESQGRRGLAESARLWIAKENPAFQALLYRKVNDGLIASIERDRSKISADPLR